MDITNMIRNKINAWIDELDMEEIAYNAIENVMTEYTGDFEEKVQEAIENELRNNYCYETEIDKAIREIVEDNMH